MEIFEVLCAVCDITFGLADLISAIFDLGSQAIGGNDRTRP
jgi:hypothetical protein